MKKLYIIWALALSLLSTLVVLNKVNAQSATWNLTLAIIGWDVTCDYTSGHDFGTLNAADVMDQAHTLSGNIGTFYCEDLRWDSDWTMTVESDQLTNGTNIPWDMTDIQVKADANTVTDGQCTAGTNATAYTTIYNTPVSVVVKSGLVNELCTIEAQNVTLKVEVPANQPIGSYSSNFEVTYPA